MALWQFWVLIGVIGLGFGAVCLSLQSLCSVVVKMTCAIEADLRDFSDDLQKQLRPMDDIGVWAAWEASKVRANHSAYYDD